MPNVCVDSSFLIFRNPQGPDHDRGAPSSPEYLRSRESAERAAAKNSCTLAARRIHQELAQMYASMREEGEVVR